MLGLPENKTARIIMHVKAYHFYFYVIVYLFFKINC